MAEPNFKEHAFNFFHDVKLKGILSDETYLHSEAERYIKSEKDFQYKDPVEVGAMLSVLRDQGLIEFKGTITSTYKSGILKYTVTEKGEEYLKNRHP